MWPDKAPCPDDASFLLFPFFARILSFSDSSGAARLDLIAYSEEQMVGLSIQSDAGDIDVWAASALNHFATGTWHHLAFTYDAENMIAVIYKNG